MERLQQLLSELGRRRVFRALLAWGIFAFAVLQVVDPVLRALDLKDWVLKAVVAGLAVGFPVTAVLSWLYDLTSKGIVRTLPVDTELAATLERPASPGRAAPGDGPAGGLSRLVLELARAPEEALRSAWLEEPRPGQKVGRFSILREIGRGGFGAVYEAQDGELGRLVALKALRPQRTGLDPSAEWIKKEAEAVARLDHPCIVTLFDVGTSEAGPYLVMELLRGQTLAQRLAAGPLAVADALHVARQVARGLAHAHQRGILHRDLKPANVFLCEDGRVKLLDFGLAHLLGQGGSQGSGTPGYMPPEQVRGDVIDPRADVYAAAMTLREMLTGQREPVADASIPRTVAHRLERALSTRREDRPRDGTAWLEDLVAVQAALARPRRVLRVAGLVAAGLVVGTGVATLLARRGAEAAPATTGGIPSVAVLPFADLSPDHDQEYFADGVAEEILDALAQLKGLKVIGRTSSFSFKGQSVDLKAIGQRLGVGTVLEGSVRRAGSRARVTAKMVNVADGATVWSQAYEREVADVFAVQEEIARAVVSALQVRLVAGASPSVGSHRTARPEVYDAYLLARRLLQRGDPEVWAGAVKAYERTLALDPGYAPAWADLGEALFWASEVAAAAPGGIQVRDELRARGLAAAERAVALAPDLPTAWSTRGFLRTFLRWDFDGARQDFERAVALSGGDARVLRDYGNICLVPLGRTQEGIAAMVKASELDPLDMNVWWFLATAYIGVGDLERASRAAERQLEVTPGLAYAAFWQMVVPLLKGRSAEALALSGRNSEEAFRVVGESLAHHSLGDEPRSRQAVETARSRWGDTVSYQLAEIYAWRGEHDQAFAQLERARVSYDAGLVLVTRDPLLRSLRGDPRYAALLGKMNLPVK